MDRGSLLVGEMAKLDFISLGGSTATELRFEDDAFWQLLLKFQLNQIPTGTSNSLLPQWHRSV